MQGKPAALLPSHVRAGEVALTNRNPCGAPFQQCLCPPRWATCMLVRTTRCGASLMHAARLISCLQDGFIHLTKDPAFLLGIGNHFYKGVKDDFLLLCLDPARLTSKVAMQDSASAASKCHEAAPAGWCRHDGAACLQCALHRLWRGHICHMWVRTGWHKACTRLPAAHSDPAIHAVLHVPCHGRAQVVFEAAAPVGSTPAGDLGQPQQTDVPLFPHLVSGWRDGDPQRMPHHVAIEPPSPNRHCCGCMHVHAKGPA